MKIYKVGYDAYNFTMKMGNKNMLVATLRSNLFGHKASLTMYFPYEDSSEIIIDTTYLTYKEVFEKSKHIIIKKMYMLSESIKADLRNTEFDDSKYYQKYSIRENFATGSVYAEKQ